MDEVLLFLQSNLQHVQLETEEKQQHQLPGSLQSLSSQSALARTIWGSAHNIKYQILNIKNITFLAAQAGRSCLQPPLVGLMHSLSKLSTSLLQTLRIPYNYYSVDDDYDS